jgi:UDP-N-acetylmuramate dehydrogenase
VRATSVDSRTTSWRPTEGVLALDRPIAAELEALLPGRVARDEPLAHWTSLRVGGPADALVRVDTREELVRVHALCRAHGLPLTILGGGFNALVRDGGLRGVVVRLAGLRAITRDGDALVRAEAGVTHTSLTRFCAEQSRSGLEFAVGIPGTVGGWIAMNAGVHGREMKDVVTAVELFEPSSGGIVTRAAAELAFRYRAAELGSGAVVLSATFATTPGAPEEIRERQKESMARRRATQPVDQPSCGSVFVNPPGDYAGRLIEAAGLKGTSEGGAMISPLHANFIVNAGGARAADVLKLIERARAAVLAQAGVALETEVRITGEEP